MVIQLAFADKIDKRRRFANIFAFTKGNSICKFVIINFKIIRKKRIKPKPKRYKVKMNSKDFVFDRFATIVVLY